MHKIPVSNIVTGKIQKAFSWRWGGGGNACYQYFLSTIY